MSDVIYSKKMFLEESLRQQIKSGNYQPHDRFPSVAKLKEQYGLSQVTVVQALDRLEAEGLLYRRKRSGTFISPVSKVRQVLVVSGVSRLKSDELNRFLCHLDNSQMESRSNLIILCCTIEEFEKNSPFLKVVYKDLFAVIFFRCPEMLLRHREELRESKVAALFYGSSAGSKQLSGCSFYCYDERTLVFRALDALYERGYRDISCFSLDTDVFEERRRHYVDWMLEKGLPVCKEKVHILPAGGNGFAYMREKLRQGMNLGRAVFCTSNSNLGTGCLQALLQAGVRIPEEVAILGVGNIPGLREFHPRPAAIEIDFQGDAARLVEFFDNESAGDAPPGRIGQSEFILDCNQTV